VTELAAADERQEPLLADIEQVRGATERAVRLTRQLLIFARRDVVHPEVLNVNCVISGVEQLLRRTLGEHIELIISPDSGLRPVEADPARSSRFLSTSRSTPAMPCRVAGS
jgi:signal transduction histidine kinase